MEAQKKPSRVRSKPEKGEKTGARERKERATDGGNRDAIRACVILGLSQAVEQLLIRGTLRREIRTNKGNVQAAQSGILQERRAEEGGAQS